MANTIILKRSATPGKVPTTSQLALGEIAINTYDGLLYIKKDDGTPSVVQIGGVTSVNSKTGAVVLSTSDVGEGSNLYFTTARARGAVSAGTSISYDSATGVISTTQNLTTAGSPSFAGLTLTGNATAHDIIPAADVTYSLGSLTNQWKDLYVGSGTIYVDGNPVLSTVNGAINLGGALDQNVNLEATGTGVLTIGAATFTGDITLTSGYKILDSANTNVQFGNAINMNSNKIINLATPTANTDAANKAYVDTKVASISTSSIVSGDSKIEIIDTGAGSVVVTVDGTSAMTVDASGVVVTGNFTVQGTTTTVNSNTVSVADNIVTLNSDATGTPTQNAGIEVERGDEANVQLRWNEGSKIWSFTNNGAVYYPMATSTDDLAEGSTNLYFTTARARSSISASSATGVGYNGTTGVISLGSIPNSSLANSSVTVGTTNIALGASSTTLDGLTSVTSTSFTGALTGNASTASKWATARTITLGGDLSGSVTIDGSQNVTLNATVAANNVALGTDTTGNYMVDVSAGTGISVSHTQGEGSTATVSIDNTVVTLNGTQTLTNKTLTSPVMTSPTLGAASATSLSTTGNVTAGGDLTVTGNFRVDGISTFKSTVVSFETNLITLNSDTINTPVDNVGFKVDRGSEADVQFRWNETNNRWESTVDGTNYLNLPDQALDKTSAVKFGNVSIDDRVLHDSATLTTSATTANQVVASVSAASYRTVEFTVSVKSGTAYQATKILVLHDGTNVNMVQYGELLTGSSLATFDADLNGGNLRLLTTPANAVTVYNVAMTAIAV